MSIGIYFAPASMSSSQYDDVIARLAAAGAGAPAGRSYHCAMAMGPNLHVFDVWDSMESFEAFGAVLMPILGEVGIDPGKPEIAELHNIIIG